MVKESRFLCRFLHERLGFLQLMKLRGGKTASCGGQMTLRLMSSDGFVEDGERGVWPSVRGADVLNTNEKSPTGRKEMIKHLITV